jgi:hypothetical protein
MHKNIAIVGEINTGHFGDLDLAFEAIKGAKDAGLDVIKFQSWAPESLFTQKHLLQNRIEAGLYKKFALDSSKLTDIAQYCSDVGIGFSSTPYSNDEVDQLAKFSNLAFIKVASMDLSEFKFMLNVFPILRVRSCSRLRKTSLGAMLPLAKITFPVDAFAVSLNATIRPEIVLASESAAVICIGVVSFIVPCPPFV